MKKKIVQTLLFLAINVFLNSSYSLPIEGQDEIIIKTAIAQDEIMVNDNILVPISEEVSGYIGCIEYTLPQNNGFKSYMPYTTITSKSSKQYDLQQIAYTGDYGIRMVDDRYCIAIGTAFDVDIGDCIDLILCNGEVIECVVADIKADEHTNADNITTRINGCVSEFIVDTNALDSYIKKLGNISFCCDTWQSEVKNIKIYKDMQ